MRIEGHEPCARKSLYKDKYRISGRIIPAKKIEENHEMSQAG